MVHRAESSPRRRVPGLVERTLEAVERSPEQFPIALRDIRKALVRRFPYVVYYVVLSDVISVIAIVHGRRDPGVWQARR